MKSNDYKKQRVRRLNAYFANACREKDNSVDAYNRFKKPPYEGVKESVAR